MSEGKDTGNDIAMSVLFARMKKGDIRAAIYFLENNNPDYYKPRPVQSREPVPEITEFNISLIQSKNKNTQIQQYSGSIDTTAKVVPNKLESLE